MGNNKIKDTLAISIDIRNSTNFYKKFNDIGKAAEEISKFIEKCYVEMKGNSKDLFDGFIYAGDGIIGICYSNDNDKAFGKMLEIALKIKIIINKEEWGFDVGIGIDYGKTVIKRIDNMDTKFNNKLYVGDSVSTATKLCKLMPFKHPSNQNKKSYIAISKDFYNKLSPENKSKFRRTKTKYIEKV